MKYLPYISIHHPDVTLHRVRQRCSAGSNMHQKAPNHLVTYIVRSLSLWWKSRSVDLQITFLPLLCGVRKMCHCVFFPMSAFCSRWQFPSFALFPRLRFSPRLHFSLVCTSPGHAILPPRLPFHILILIFTLQPSVWKVILLKMILIVQVFKLAPPVTHYETSFGGESITSRTVVILLRAEIAFIKSFRSVNSFLWRFTQRLPYWRISKILMLSFKLSLKSTHLTSLVIGKDIARPSTFNNGP